MNRNNGFCSVILAGLMTVLAACGGDDDPFTPPPGGPSAPQLPNPASAPALKTTLAAKYGVVNFPVGAAIEPGSTTDASDSALLIKHFSSITAENVMKPDTIVPSYAEQVRCLQAHYATVVAELQAEDVPGLTTVQRAERVG